MTNEPLNLQPFVPSGRDFERSRALFRELGFRELWSGEGYVGFQMGAARFILQDFNDTHFAENLMIRIEVPDLDLWWEKTAALDLGSRFEGVRLKPPTRFPWGREAHLIDLAGVCWHIGAP